MRRSCDERGSRLNQLVSDHEAMQRLHQQLTREYDSLVVEHNNLKSEYKTLKMENKELKVRQWKWTECFYRVTPQKTGPSFQ